MPLRERLSGIAPRPLYLWLFLWFGVGLLYMPAWKAGFQQDFQGWLELYYDYPFWRMLNRDMPSVHSFYHLTQLQLYILTSLFKTHPLPWFLVFTGLHALNGTLLFRFCRELFRDFGLRHASEISFVGTLLVLFNPSMTEVVVWKASYHYLIAVQGILWSLFWTRRYIVTGDQKWATRCIVLLVFLAFTLELWYTIPVLGLLLMVAYWRSGIIQTERLQTSVKRLFIPQMAVFALHLLAYRLIYGSWLPHSAYSGPGNDSPFLVAARTWAYEWHLLGFGRLFPHNIRQAFYHRFGGVSGGVLAIAITAILIEWTWRKFPRWNATGRLATFLGTCALVALVIILHYPPSDILLVGNDRYLYLTAFFQWMMVAVLTGAIFNQRAALRRITYSVVLLGCLAATGYLVLNWRHSAKVFWAIQDKFRWKDAPVTLILNMPSNYNGIGIITGRDTSELPAHLHVFGKGEAKGRVCDVSSYNMQHPWDGAHVVVEDSNRLHVTLNQWGSWWWLNGFGALDRSNDLFELHFNDPGHDYILTLKQHPPGMVILFQQGQEWREVDMKKIGVEQK